MCPIIYLQSIPIPVYGTIIMIAYITGTIIASFNARIYGYNKRNIYISSAMAVVGMFSGSKIFYFICTFPYYLKHMEVLKAHPYDCIKICLNGYVFYGGLAGALLMIYLYCLQMDYSFLEFSTVFIPSIPFIHAFGRIGCFMGGCCYGIKYNGLFSITFPKQSLINHLGDYPRFPVQLLESAALFILFIIFTLNYKKHFRPGYLLGIYLCSYSIIRFSIEFLRADYNRGFLLSLSSSQWISIILIYIGVHFVRISKNWSIN